MFIEKMVACGFADLIGDLVAAAANCREIVMTVITHLPSEHMLANVNTRQGRAGIDENKDYGS